MIAWYWLIVAFILGGVVLFLPIVSLIGWMLKEGMSVKTFMDWDEPY